MRALVLAVLSILFFWIGFATLIYESDRQRKEELEYACKLPLGVTSTYKAETNYGLISIGVIGVLAGCYFLGGLYASCGGFRIVVNLFLGYMIYRTLFPKKKD